MFKEFSNLDNMYQTMSFEKEFQICITGKKRHVMAINTKDFYKTLVTDTKRRPFEVLLVKEDIGKEIMTEDGLAIQCDNLVKAKNEICFGIPLTYCTLSLNDLIKEISENPNNLNIKKLTNIKYFEIKDIENDLVYELFYKKDNDTFMVYFALSDISVFNKTYSSILDKVNNYITQTSIAMNYDGQDSALLDNLIRNKLLLLLDLIKDNLKEDMYEILKDLLNLELVMYQDKRAVLVGFIKFLRIGMKEDKYIGKIAYDEIIEKLDLK